MGKLTSTPGYYDVVIDKATIVVSKQGTPGVAIQVHRAGDAADTGVVSLWLSDKARDYTMETLRSLGWDAAGCDYEVADLEDNNPLHEKPAEVLVAAGSFNGNETIQIKYINAPGARPGPKPLDPAQRALLSAHVRSSMGLPPKARKNPSAEIPNDEVPF